ncbi:SDR family NAD(P)-dependent oxidoreductase [Pedobacter sp. ISL-68]|uniref:oxidoreductase n=1 Tax=unclassified Pedobacter TaxID=2628915 RepID=UPI001BEAA337|nr:MULTISPECIES: oxidoreductase [unclassified Pedobacter]MBT2560261.1 SDR family NAD(P)-dependent oxidoreductase [Pedobacter sp. ISL-64]MBT2589241.1 SDR family NAD(P)-dependent oxidoreductase [Pedobacter sp. ISL-68]
MKNPNTFLITGASQGLGLIIVKQLLSAGKKVIATTRNADTFDPETKAHANLEVISLDLTDENSVASMVKDLRSRYSNIDVLINNAGFGFAGAIEEAQQDEVAKVIELNVLATIRMTRLVLPLMREQKKGHIINLSSNAGLVSTAGFGIYNASKYAVEGFSEALLLEVTGLGIQVTLIEPGAFRTNFLASSLALSRISIADYDPTAGLFKTRLNANNGSQPGDPVKGAQAIIRVSEMENPPLRLLLGQDAYNRVTAKLKAVSLEIENLKQVTLSTDFN